MIEIIKGIFLNKKEITFQASKSSGPGGQHVNKVNSKVELSYPLDKIMDISEDQVNTVKEKLSSYIVEDDIRISSQKHRSQYSNKLDATEKLVSLLRKALLPNKPRIKTRIPKSAIEKRLYQKRKQAIIKKDRNLNLDNDM